MPYLKDFKSTIQTLFSLGEILKRFIADFKHLYGKLKSTFEREKCKNRCGKIINVKLK